MSAEEKIKQFLKQIEEDKSKLPSLSTDLHTVLKKAFSGQIQSGEVKVITRNKLQEMASPKNKEVTK